MYNKYNIAILTHNMNTIYQRFSGLHGVSFQDLPVFTLSLFPALSLRWCFPSCMFLSSDHLFVASGWFLYPARSLAIVLFPRQDSSPMICFQLILPRQIVVE